MAVLENTGSGGATIASTLGITNFPFTIAAWVRRTSTVNDDKTVAGFGNSAGTQNYHRVKLNLNHYAQAQGVYGNGTIRTATDTSAIMAADTWVPVVGRFTSSASREIFRQALANTDEDTNDVGGWSSGTNAINQFSLLQSASGAQDLGGQIAHVAVWNKALTNTEVEAFLNGANPLATTGNLGTANANLAAYWAETFFQNTDWYYQDESGNERHMLLESGAVRNDSVTGPTVDAPPATTNPGITITDIKEPNEADELVTGVSNARVKLWVGADNVGAEGDLIEGVTITAGVLSTGVLGDPAIGASVIVTVDWVASVDPPETKFFRTATTVVDLDA